MTIRAALLLLRVAGKPGLWVRRPLASVYAVGTALLMLADATVGRVSVHLSLHLNTVIANDLDWLLAEVSRD